MKVFVFGAGVVGGALITYLRENKHEILVKDTGRILRADVNSHGIDAYFICVPIPTKTDGKVYSQDLSAVHDCLKQIKNKKALVFIRSTIQPGACDDLADQYWFRIFQMPEFLTERRAYEDMRQLPVIAGIKGKDNFDDCEAELVLKGLFPDKKLSFCKNREAEFSKYAHNAFAAVKVNFFNVVKEYCDKFELDYDKVLKQILMSGFINKEHTSVPGHDGLLGYGGKCLPKDIKIFHECVKGISSVMLLNDIENGIRRENDTVNKKGLEAQALT